MIPNPMNPISAMVFFPLKVLCKPCFLVVANDTCATLSGHRASAVYHGATFRHFRTDEKTFLSKNHYQKEKGLSSANDDMIV